MPKQRRSDLLAFGAVVLLAGALTWAWFVIGPDNPIYALVVACGTFAAGPLLGEPVARRVPRGWFRVADAERAAHRALGVHGFGRLLERSGWNRAVADPMRSFDGTRAGLPALDHDLRGNVSAHGTAFVFHVAIAAVAALTGHLWGALWILLPGILLHLYPVLLQRCIALRLQPLTDRLAHR